VDALATELGLFTLPAGCPDGTERIRMTLMREGSLDGAFAGPAGMRYRFNVYRESDRHAIAVRRLDSTFRSFAELGLPPRLADFCGETDGLVIVTGPTGSGKSTTLATMIDAINRKRAGHIVTIEDPIEFVHAPKTCMVSQRQVGRDVKSFNDAIVEAMRQDPDVILVGETRDLATVRAALRAAETGHLVFTTLHAGDCAGALERLVSVFPAEEQNSARHQLALVLRGVFAQHLLASPDGSRHPACELLVNTPACANVIATGRPAQIYSIIETGGQQGMKTLDQSLAELLAAGRIDERTACALSRNPETLKGRLRLC
jgi:twitching motility protein PilT